MNPAPTHLFVYGTLRHGFSNDYARLLHRQSRYVGEGTMPGLLFNLGYYPGATYTPDSQSLVHGSVFDVGKSTAIFLRLDDYEGISQPPAATDEYVRAIVPIRINGETLRCWAYLYQQATDGKNCIVSGQYVP